MCLFLLIGIPVSALAARCGDRDRSRAAGAGGIVALRASEVRDLEARGPLGVLFACVYTFVLARAAGRSSC